MRHVFLSFLGLGPYSETVYELDGRTSSRTQFVQVAEQELLGWETFDRLIIVTTTASHEKYFKRLQQDLSQCRGRIKPIILEEDMSEKGQWRWFEIISSTIREHDRLCVDLTHGYRSTPIIFSAAIHFLQKTKRIELANVFYGAFEKDRQCAPLVDMRSFYDINIWADAVTRLTNDADAGGFSEAVGRTGEIQFKELADKPFVDACADVTRRIKNVDMNNVANAAIHLNEQIERISADCSPEARILLDLVRKKFVPLVTPATGNPHKTGYTLDYFRVQIELARLLLHHGLFMQAFTVMWEWLGTLVLLFFERNEPMNADKRRKKCNRFATVLVQMILHPQENWDFKEKEADKDKILPFYEALKRHGILELLTRPDHNLVKELSSYRNGLNHAWLSKAGMKDDMEQQGHKFLATLEEVLKKIETMDY